MTAVPRHRQTPVSIRSDKAAALLARLTQAGRSQAQVIEDALEKVDAETPRLSKEEFVAAIDSIVAPVLAMRNRPTFKELDDAMWDENGLPI